MALENHNNPTATLLQSLPNKTIYVGITSEPNEPFPIPEVGGGGAASDHTVCRQPWEQLEKESIIHLIPEDTKGGCFVASDLCDRIQSGFGTASKRSG